MKRWMKWGLWVLVPVTLYVGAYVFCCHWPRGWPMVQRFGAWPRGVQAVFAPLMEVHGGWVERRALKVMVGKWEPADGSGWVEVEFRPDEGDGDVLLFQVEERSGDGVHLGYLTWVAGTAKVGTVTFGEPPVEFGVVGRDRLMGEGVGGKYGGGGLLLRRVVE